MGNDRFDYKKIRKDICEKQKEERWNKIHSRVGTREELRNQYDGWLEQDQKLEDLLKKCHIPILDLGCGVGIDTLHLVEHGHRVIASDFSTVAIQKVNSNIPEAITLQFNMKNKLPFEKEVFEFIIANKSIHYFSEEETRNLISELYRILKPNGIFAFVVNSTKDRNFGAGQGIKLEDNFYEVRGTTKRFFDEKSLNSFFDKENWDFIYMNEGELQNDRIKTIQLQNNTKETDNKKITWTCAVKKR